MRENRKTLAGLLLLAAPAFGACPQGMAASDGDGGAVQTLTVSDEPDSRTVGEIRIDGNNAVLLFTNGEQLSVDMRLVTLTMSYDEVTGVGAVRLGGSAGAGARVYDLRGRLVTEDNPQSGVYIVNGKKVSYKKR